MTSRSPIPVILDTDIGTDIDDTWALAQLLRSPELAPKLILTGAGGIEFRTTVTARYLEVCGRTDVPVGRGIPAWETEESHRGSKNTTSPNTPAKSPPTASAA